MLKIFVGLCFFLITYVRGFCQISCKKRAGTLLRRQGFFSDLQKKVDDEVWDFVYGRKERQWSPDRRPDGERGIRAGPGPDSRLSWGGAENMEMYEEAASTQAQDLVALTESVKNAPMGLAATTIFGEGSKEADPQAEMSRMRLAQVPSESSASRYISSPEELAELIFAKYGRYHDASVLRNTGQIAFNIYGPYLGLRSFPYTESQYLEKLNIVAVMLGDFDQAWYVKEFLLSPIAPRNGLPSTPRFDTAVTLRLNLSPTWGSVDSTVVDEWFSAQQGI